MSANPVLRNRVDVSPDCNPKVPGPMFNRYNTVKDTLYLWYSSNTIAASWTRKGRRRAQARMLRILANQTERARLIALLNERINMKDWMALLEGGDDVEMQWSSSENDRERVLIQARAVCRALEIMYESVVEQSKCSTWQDCCERVSAEQKTASWWTISRWFREFMSGGKDPKLHDDDNSDDRE